MPAVQASATEFRPEHERVGEVEPVGSGWPHGAPSSPRPGTCPQATRPPARTSRSLPRVTETSGDELPPLDPVRGAETARQLKALGVKGRPLLRAAELGYITELLCAMPTCFCPVEMGGGRWFAPRAAQWNDWEPTFEHFPIPKVEGGRATPENGVLAHRVCNKLDHSIRNGLPIEKDLARIERARVAAIAANLSQAGTAPGAVAQVFAAEPKSSASSPRKRNARAWKSLPPAGMASHLLATRTISDSSWTTEHRRPGENRERFIYRILLGESPESASD